MNYIQCMGFKVFSDSLDAIEMKKGKELLTTISPNSYGISTRDSLFRKVLKDSDFLVLDGVYFSLASMLLHGKNIIKNQGPDVFKYFLRRMNNEKGKVFFLGSTESTLEKINKKMSEEYPQVEVGYYSPPYKDEFDENDNRLILEQINNFKPNVLFVAMTCPKQEKWAGKNKDRIDADLTCCLGAVFDWFAGNQKEISPIWWKLRLGWLKRTIDRPEILKRYPNIGIFFWHLFLALIGFKKFRYGNF